MTKRIFSWLYRRTKKPELQLTIGAFYGILALGGLGDLARISFWMVKNAKRSRKETILSGVQKRGQQGNGDHSGHEGMSGVRSGHPSVPETGTGTGLRASVSRTGSDNSANAGKKAKGIFPSVICPDCKSTLAKGFETSMQEHFQLCLKCGYDSRRTNVSMQSHSS